MKTEIKKEKIGRIWYYTVPLEVDGVKFSIIISRNQLLQIMKKKKSERLLQHYNVIK